MSKDSKKTLAERFAERSGESGFGATEQVDDRPLAERAVESSGRRWFAGRQSRREIAEDQSTASYSNSSKSRNYAEIDIKGLEKRGFVTPTLGRSKIVEEYRGIKRPLLKRAFEEAEGPGISRNHVIMVTSSKPNEGKTFTATNLAMSIASERGLNVLLVDADVIKRDLPSQLGFYAEYGFLDVLEDASLTLPDVMVRTNIPNLTVLPSGQHAAHATELLASPGMKSLMSDLATRYSDRVIIIDSPPVLLSSETGVLASLVGQIVVVVEAEKTSRRDLEQSISLLEAGGTINLVMNKVTDRKSSERYGAYYYYYKPEKRNGR